MSAPRSLFDKGTILSPVDMMSRSEAQSFLERVVKLSRADTIGAREIYNQIAIWHQRYGARWKPSELLRQLAENGGKLREAKADKLR